MLAVRALAAPPYVEGFVVRHAREISGNPSDLHFRLETVNGQRTFRVGEAIALALVFSSDSPDKYKLNGATYDRSGRLPTEEFVLERSDVPDPYLDYFGAGVLGWLAGGLRGYPVLESKPYTIEVCLNDWFRFDVPGRYRFFVKSHRLARERAPGETGGRTVPFAAVSDIVEIEIKDDEVWRAAKLAELREVLEQPEPELPKLGGPPVPHNPLSEKIPRAWRELRYLGTPAAVEYAFDHARRKGSQPETLLLVGARDRARMLTAFDTYLGDPQVGLTEWDVRLRALFTFVRKEQPKMLPTFAWQVAGPEEWPKNRALAEANQKRYEKVLQETVSGLIPLVAYKQGEARTVSARAVAALAPEAAGAAGLVPPRDYGLTRDELIAGFAKFTTERQTELLGEKWDLVRGPEMVPVLAKVIAGIQPTAPLEGRVDLNVWGVDSGITDSAIRRLAELSPEEAARIVERDLASGKPRLAGYAVREFETREIPAADEAFAAMLVAGSPIAPQLVAKFGSAALAPQMRELNQTRNRTCAAEEPLVTYFVRVFPEEEGEGRDVLRRAMADRKQRGCFRWLLARVASVSWNAAVRAQALVTLEDSDPEVVTNAAGVLGSYGDASVEAPIWKKLEQWSARWKGRASELDGHPIRNDLPHPERQVGERLAEVLASAGSWVLDEPRRKRLVALCIDDWCRERWDHPTPPGPVSLDVSSGGSHYPAAFRADGYTARTLAELKNKLLQYPAGTSFRWCPQATSPFDAFTPGQREDMFKDVAAFLAKRSIAIEPYSAEKCGQR